MASTVQNQKTPDTPNAVDGLLRQVDEIQSACEHEFQPTEECSRDHQPLRVANEGTALELHSRRFAAQCTKCSYSEDIQYIDRCACCLGRMSETAWEDARKYFGVETNPYYAAAVFTCEGCGFSVVTMVWDK
jgi:hypothetical protein